MAKSLPLFGKRIAAYDRTYPRPSPPKRKRPGLVHVIAHVRSSFARKFKGK